MKKSEALITAAIILLIAMLIAFSNARKPEVTGTETVMVHAGDTLWDMADEYCPASVDKCEWIYAVKKMNKITVLSPGEIEVIVYE